MRNDEIRRPHRLYLRRTRDEHGEPQVEFYEDTECAKLFAVRKTPIVYSQAGGFRKIWLDGHKYFYEWTK